MYKKCADCNQVKDAAEFGRNKQRKDGLHSYCRECTNRQERERYARSEERRAQVKARSARWHEANREKSREKTAKWRANNIDKVRAKKAAEYAENKDAIVVTLRDAAFNRKYGISLEARDALAASQGHRCLICGRHEDDLDKRLAVDHDHKNGRIRGLLCANCNIGLGHFADDPRRLSAAIAYLLHEQDRNACTDCRDCSVHNPKGASA